MLAAGQSSAQHHVSLYISCFNCPKLMANFGVVLMLCVSNCTCNLAMLVAKRAEQVLYNMLVVDSRCQLRTLVQ